MTTGLPRSAPAVIIGGGIIGTSVLYHLGQRNIEGAVLLERKRLASGTTWHAAGIVGQLRESSAQTELAKYSVRLFRKLEEETGQATGYKQNGTLHLALSGVRMEQLHRSHDHAVRMNVPTELLTRDEIASIWPLADLTGVLGGFLVPSNGQVNPLDVTLALAKGARQRGGIVLENTEAVQIITTKGKVAGVETAAGTIATEKVVLAAGMWSHRFAKAHGVTVPLHAAEHVYLVTEPIEGLSRSLPGLVVAEERVYAKEDAGKLLIGAFEANAKAWGQSGIPDSFEFDQLPFDMEHLAPYLETMFERFPILGSTGIKTYFCGPESFTPDGRPYLGPSPELPGLFIAAGMNSNGILNAGGVGLTLAQWLIDGAPARGMGSLLASRAHPFQSNRAYNTERVTEALGFHMGLAWPGRQVESARGIRRVPLHDRLKAAGALFSERIGWEIPMVFEPALTSWPTTPSLGWQDWHSAVAAECHAARDSAVLLDQSMYGKFLVQGPDAVRSLDRVAGAKMDVTAGTSIYTQLLNRRGGIEADVTVTRLAPDRFLVITGHPSQIRDQAWIKTNADPAWRFEIFDATSAYALLSLHGPRSRDILAALSLDDLSNTSFPFGTAREIDLAHARVWAIRRSFLGELGYELLVLSEFAAHVYEALLAAGVPHGLRHAGQFAMNACRLEKAFRHFGHDIGEDDTPFETGLGFTVDMSKTDFLGRDCLAEQKRRWGSATPYRTVAVSVPTVSAESGPWLIHNEPIWKDGDLVGHVTSGGWGFRLRRMIGLATVHREMGVSNDWIKEGGFEVKIAGEQHAAVLQLEPLYDPKGERMRS